MGYSTYFDGVFELNRRLTASELETMRNLTDYSNKPDDTPDSECQWIIDEVGDTQILRHDYEEKFYNWDEWLTYLTRLFDGWGVKMGGSVVFQGEDTGDCGLIVVEDNKARFFNVRDLVVPDA